MITVWPASADEADGVWRGTVETVDGRRLYFHNGDGLLQLLAELSGWPDAAA
jgi:hypothetical protein